MTDTANSDDVEGCGLRHVAFAVMLTVFWIAVFAGIYAMRSS